MVGIGLHGPLKRVCRKACGFKSRLGYREEIMDIVLAGDSHGNTGYVLAVLTLAASQGLDKAFILGDFGIWPGKDGRAFLDTVNDDSEFLGVTVYFLDGNHEDFSQLNEWSKTKPVDDEGFVMVRPNIRWARRGHRWTWGGTDFMALGGAYSIDKAFRSEGSSWWADELITDNQEDFAKRPGNVDILLTHDCSTAYPIPMARIYESHNNQQRLDRVAEAVRPKVWFHGHMHRHVSYQFMDTPVYGLSYEFEPGCMRVLTVKNGDWHL